MNLRKMKLKSKIYYEDLKFICLEWGFSLSELGISMERLRGER